MTIRDYTTLYGSHGTENIAREVVRRAINGTLTDSPEDPAIKMLFEQMAALTEALALHQSCSHRCIP